MSASDVAKIRFRSLPPINMQIEKYQVLRQPHHLRSISSVGRAAVSSRFAGRMHNSMSFGLTEGHPFESGMLHFLLRGGNFAYIVFYWGAYAKCVCFFCILGRREDSYGQGVVVMLAGCHLLDAVCAASAVRQRFVADFCQLVDDAPSNRWIRAAGSKHPPLFTNFSSVC